MRKRLAFLLCIVFVTLSTTACGSNSASSSDSYVLEGLDSVFQLGVKTQELYDSLWISYANGSISSKDLQKIQQLHDTYNENPTIENGTAWYNEMVKLAD